MSGRQQREDAGVDDAQVARAVHLEISANNTTISLGRHLAAAGGVVQRGGVGAHELLDRSIGRDVGAGEHLDGAEALDGVRGADGARVLDGLDEQPDVERVAEEGRGRDGGVEGVVGGGADAAAGEGVLQAQDQHARVEDELHHGRVGGSQARVEDGLLLLVACYDLCRRVGGEVLRAVLGLSRGHDGGRGIGVVGQGQEEEEVSRGGRVGAGAVLLVLLEGGGGEGGVAEVGRGELASGDCEGEEARLACVLMCMRGEKPDVCQGLGGKLTGSHGRQEHVVLEVLADGREIDDSLDANLAQEAAGTDSGHLEDLRGVERASSEDGLGVDTDSRPGGIGRSSKLSRC